MQKIATHLRATHEPRQEQNKKFHGYNLSLNVASNLLFVLFKCSRESSQSVWLLVNPFPTPGLGPDCLISPSDRPSKKLSTALLAAEFLDFMMLKGRAPAVSMKKREFTIRRMTKKLRGLAMAAILRNVGDEADALLKKEVCEIRGHG